MPHPAVVNLTPFAFEALFLADEEGRPLVVPIVKATYDITPNGLRRAEKQRPIDPAGEFWGEPDVSPYKLEPETAFFKAATDVFLVGTARPARPHTTHLQAALRVGPLQKIVDVIGDRAWYKAAGAIMLTAPLPIDATSGTPGIPLSYDRAFGGRDPAGPELEPRNPCGTGFWSGSGVFPDNLRAPNLEDPEHRITTIKQRPPPAGFGPIGPGWEPRRKLGGTYDERWKEARFPLLPEDFDRRFFNAASPGLVAHGYLRGDEPVVVLNASPVEALRLDLPGIPPPRLRVQRAREDDAVIDTRLDTVIVDTDTMQLRLLWRASATLRRGPEDLRALEISTELPRGA